MEYFKSALSRAKRGQERLVYFIKFWLLRLVGSEKDIGGVRVILIRDGRVVLVRHWLSQNVWTLPGGGIDKGESPSDAGKREVWEEVGYTVNSFDDRLGIYRGRMGDKDSVIVLITSDFEGGMKWLPNLEIMERGLFDLDHLPENVSPANRRRLVAFKHGVRNQRGKW
ncbi:MAG TPA: NUDIX domain-containing protein [Candidatus Paceibacterota bacterium]|nr:NUDIX domain-containing protein [Candidatus Paceibacterota bacterium]